MPDTTHNALTEAIHAMHEVVIPAVDPDHPLAREQARLIAGLLSLLDERIDSLRDRDRFELRLLVDQAAELQASASQLSPAIAGELESLVARSGELLARPDAETGAVRELAARLAAVTTALVRTACDADPAMRRHIEKVVLNRSHGWLDAQRAWFRPQGWEPNATDLPDLHTALSR